MKAFEEKNLARNDLEKKLKTKPPIIALVGMCGAGKSSVAALLIEFGYKGVYFGGITIAEVKKRKMVLNAENERKVREDLRRGEGMEVFARRSLPSIRRFLQDGERVYIDGLYSYQEYLLLLKNFSSQLVVVEVYADKALRKHRLATRATRALTAKEVDERDKKEIEELDKAPPIALSDYKIDNNGNKAALKNDFKKLLKKIEKIA